jgi:hypothetical protein
MRTSRVLAAAVPAVLLLTAHAASAQGFLSLGVGAGTGVGRHDGPTAEASHAHAQAYLQLGAPLLPVAVRGDALVMGNGTAGHLFSVAANAVVSLPIPIVTPYATLGWGTYGMGQSGGGKSTTGWSAGVGARAKLPLIPGIFAEVRRHQRLGRDLATVGVVF